MCTKTLWRFGSQQVADGGVGEYEDPLAAMDVERQAVQNVER